MNLLDTGFSLSWQIGSGLIALYLMIYALKTAPWYKVKQDVTAINILIAMSLVLLFTWQGAASLSGSTNFHFLLMGATTLMFGWQFASLAGGMALVGLGLLGKIDWNLIGLNWLLMAILPSLIVWQLAKWAYRYLDRNFFVFVLFSGFLASSMALLISLSVTTLVLLTSEQMTWDTLQHDFVRYFPMIVLPEGFLNGMIVAVLILLKPHWLSCFQDEHYLNKK